ncbi:MAG: CHAT domain-containing protein [Saprospiraceae bacterium]|nr:CHAT domain-containing protein [Saprospiraceae bacterium]
MKITFLLLSLLFFYSTFSFAQEVKDTALISQMIEEADAFRANKQFQNAQIKLLDAIELYDSKLLDFPKYKIALLRNIGGLNLDKGNYENALMNFEEALDIINEKLPKTDKSVIRTYLDIGIAHYYLGNYDFALLNYEYAENITLKTRGTDDVLLSNCYNNIGICYYVKQNYKKALDYYKKALSLGLKKLGENHIQIASMYNNIGICYKLLLDYNQAITYYNNALGIKLAQLPEDHPNLVPNYNNLGSCYNSIFQHEKALEYYTKAAEILLENFGQNHPMLASVYNNIGNCYSQMEYYPEALDHLQKSLEISQKIHKDFFPEIGNTLGNIGNCLIQQRNYDKALDYFDQALNYYHQKRHEYPAKIGEYYTQKGSTYKRKQDFTNAQKMFDKALQALHYQTIDFNAIERHFAPNNLMKALAEKAQSLVEYQIKTRNTEYLFEAQQLFNEAILVLEYIKTSFQESDSKQILLEKSYNIYEGAIAACHQLNQISGDQKYLLQAFEYAEKSNAILLQEAVQKTNAERFANIPDSLLEKEQDLKVEIAFYEAKRYNEDQKGPNADELNIHEWNNLIFDFKEEYFELMKVFEEQYPTYFELRYESKTVPVEEIQSNLINKNEAFIEYFIGDDHAFVFVITKDTLAMLYIPKIYPLEAWVEELRGTIVQYNPLIENISMINQKYVNIANELYKLLFAPLNDLVKDKSLIIVPGGILGYLPFEALLTELPDTAENYRSHPYLVNEYQISYSYSAFLFKEKFNTKKNQYRGNFLGIAPRFDTPLKANPNGSRTYELGALQYNIPEVENISAIMGGKVYIDSLATEQNFRNAASDYQILHLATHGKANDQSSDYSFLAFYEIEDDIENELLYVKDLYNLDLQADMVVLSACETGIGELKRGEGLISLARGFFYAGVRSIITTLWSIDDKPTAQIMENFYVNLKQNQTKDAALRSAKLTYINNQSSDAKTHPRYWAGFVPIGNMAAIKAQNESRNYWLWSLGALLLVGGFVYYFKK